MKNRNQDQNIQWQRRWLDPKQLCDEYGFSENNQSQMRMDKRIPYSKVGGYIRYDRIKIDKWLENNEIKWG